jgi:hypothetical protein
MSGEKNTLEKAQEVAQQMKTDADREYSNGVTRRNELRQWADAKAAVKRVQTRYDLLKLIQSNAQSNYDHYVRWYGWCWWRNSCIEDRRAAKHWRGLMNSAYPNIAVAKARATPNGISMIDELDMAKQHLKWINDEEWRAQLVKWIVDSSFEEDVYKQLAALTFNSAGEDIVKAKAAVTRASNRVAAVSDEVLQKTRQAKYNKADLYLRQQRVIHDAEQAVIAEKQAVIAEKQAEIAKEQARRQALTDREDQFLYLMMELLYGDDLWNMLWHI